MTSDMRFWPIPGAAVCGVARRGGCGYIRLSTVGSVGCYAAGYTGQMVQACSRSCVCLRALIDPHLLNCAWSANYVAPPLTNNWVHRQPDGLDRRRRARNCAGRSGGI